MIREQCSVIEIRLRGGGEGHRRETSHVQSLYCWARALLVEVVRQMSSSGEIWGHCGISHGSLYARQ